MTRIYICLLFVLLWITICDPFVFIVDAQTETYDNFYDDDGGTSSPGTTPSPTTTTTLSPGTMPPGTLPPGTMPPGSTPPPGTRPPGTIPTGMTLSPATFVPTVIGPTTGPTTGPTVISVTTTKPSKSPTINPTFKPTSNPTKICNYQREIVCNSRIYCIWKKVDDGYQCTFFNCNIFGQAKCALAVRRCQWNKNTSTCVRRSR